MFEKSKVRAYLQNTENKTAFCFLLCDFASGKFEKTLKAMSFSQIKTELE